MRLARPLENLIEQLQKLPNIGPKTAQRLALYILKLDIEEASSLSSAIIEAKNKVFPCKCGYLTDREPCIICNDLSREDKIICVAEETSDVIALERTGFKGRYYVLNKSLNILDDNDIENINLEPLIEKLASGLLEEVILALNPDMDGEIMTRYLATIAGRYKVKATRLAYGLPVGGDIEFTDEITLRKAFEGRKEIE